MGERSRGFAWTGAPAETRPDWMSVALYIYEHVPFAITVGLSLRDVDVLTAQADGKQRTSDREIFDRATELRRGVYAQDEDFLAEAHRRQQIGEAFAGVVYAHQLNVTIGQCVADRIFVWFLREPDNDVFFVGENAECITVCISR